MFRQAACGPLAWSVLPTYLQQLVILSGLAVRSFSTEVYTSALGCCSGQNWSVLGKHKMRQKKATPTENFELLHADSYIKLSRKQPQPTKSSHVPCMGCVRASDAPNSSRRQPETTDEVFYKLHVASHRHKKSRKIVSKINSTRRQLVAWLQRQVKSGFHQKLARFLTGVFNL